MNDKAKTAEAPKERMFYSEDGTDIRVTLPGGGVAIVNGEPRTLPKQYHREAMKAGCLIEGGGRVEKIEFDPVTDEIGRQQRIKAKILEAARADENSEGYEDAFTGAGKASVKWLEEQLGFSVTADERDAIQAEVEALLEKEADEGEQD